MRKTSVKLTDFHYAFQKQANSEVQKLTEVCVFRCRQLSQRTSQETELYLNGFKTS